MVDVPAALRGYSASCQVGVDSVRDVYHLIDERRPTEIRGRRSSCVVASARLRSSSSGWRSLALGRPAMRRSAATAARLHKEA